MGRLGIEDFLDAVPEQPSDPECEWQSRVVFAGFDCVHCLTRYVESLRKLGLGPVTLRAQNAQSVLHRYRQVAASCPTTQPIIITKIVLSPVSFGTPMCSRVK